VRQGIASGDRTVMYPMMHWVLFRFPQLQKRAYLARFLMNLDIPQEYMQDDTMQHTYSHYKEIQMQFKETHKKCDSLRSNQLAPTELKKEITQLEEERAQLVEKISTLKRRTNSADGFDELLEVTSALRKAQEDESKLVEREREQGAQLQHAERMYSEQKKRLDEVKSSQEADVTAEELLAKLKEEVQHHVHLVERKLPFDIQQKKEKLKQLQAQCTETPRTEAEVVEAEQQSKQMQQQIHEMQQEIEEAQRNGGDDKLAIYRTHAQGVAKKLAAKEEEIEAAQEQREKVLREVHEKEELVAQLSGPKYMKKEEFKKYAVQLREKTNAYKRMRAELAELRTETVVLNRTETILRSRDANLQDFIQKQEQKAGVEGFTETVKQLEQVSEQTATLNETKGKTLEEISKIVTDINQALKERKNKLAPQIKELRAVRQRYQELEQEYLEKKAVYENTAVGLETERIKLEQECSAHQEDCLREESRYHYLHCLLGIADAHYERVQQEMKFEKNEGRLLRDFRCYKDLYQEKLERQERLSKELRKQKKAITENEGGNLEQRQMFTDLRKLLNCKLQCLNTASLNASGNNNGMGSTKTFESVDFGGANVMTLDN